jgi:glutaconyl-CoA/methylmalonyl-CoA decarboxylase subunit gamma
VQGANPFSPHTVFANRNIIMDHLRITVEGKVYEVTVEAIGTETPAQPAPAIRSAAPAPGRAAVHAPAATPLPAAAQAGDALSPLAGIVQAIEAPVGTSVREGDLVITLEAMKMYTPIHAIASGTITALHVKAGQAVEEGQVLYTIG